MPSKKLNFRDSTGISEEERKVVKNSFTCLLCPETFSHESTLKRHAKLHSNRALFSCDVCFRSFNKKTQLKLHKKVHTRKKSYQCSICTESFTNSSNLSSHLQTHNSKNLFECTVCGKCFTNRYILKRHMKTHPLHNNPTQDGKNIFKKSINCALCTKTFTHERGLKQHKKLHNKESPVMCDVCFKGFSLKLDLNSHMKVHTAVKYHQCKICSKNFLHITTLSEHTQNHKDTQFKCTMCEKCFERRDLLKLHMKVHPSAIMDRTREHNLEVADLNKPSELLFRKEKENKLPIQLKNANISKQNRKMKIFPRPNLRHRGISHSQEKPFKCHVCFKGFYQRWNLKLHMKTHSHDKLQMKVQTSSTWVASSQQNHSLEVSNSNNSKSLINDEADEDDVPLISLLHFPSRNISKQNMVKDLSIFNLFPKSSSYKHSLKQQRKSQSTERPFTCNICFKGFQQNTKLKVHMKEHSGEKPFQCKTNSDKENRYIKPSLESVEYEKSFIKSSQLKHDIKRHIPSESCITYDYLESNPSNFESLGKELTVDEEKSPAIECVDLLSSKPPNLEQEKITSKSFSCNLCSKTFSLKSTLRQHRKSHSNGRPFTCNVCYKRFDLKSNLKLHIRSHTGKNPYRCKICKKRFSHSRICTRQIQTDSLVKRFTASTLKHHLKTHARDSKETVLKEPHKNNVGSEDKKVLNIKCKSNEPDRKTAGKDTKECSIELENRLIQTRIERKIFSEMSDDYSEFFIRERGIEKDHESRKSTHNDHDKTLINQDAAKDEFEILSEYKKCHNNGVLFSVKTIDIELTKEKPFQCKFCNKAYSKARKLKYHEKEVHMGKNLAKKTLQCKFCSKKYSSKKKLRKHEKRFTIGKDSNLEDFEYTDSFSGSVVQKILKK